MSSSKFIDSWRQIKLKGQQALGLIIKYCSPATLTAIICGVMGIYLLLIAPIHGYADNGDFNRVLNGNNLYALKGSNSQYVVTQYGIKQYYNDLGSGVWKTQSFFIQLAILINKMFFSTHIFDIRFLGLVYLIAYIASIYMFTKSLVPGRRSMGAYVFAILVGIVAGDSAFLMYFNSFYPQATTLIFLVLAVALLIYIPQLHGRKLFAAVIGYFIAVFLLIMGDYSVAPLGVVFAIASAGLFFLPRIRYQRWYLGAGVAMILITSGISTTMLTPEEQMVNKFQSFTKGVLANNDDPISSLSNASLNKQFILMKDQDYFPTDYTALKPDSKYVQHNLIDKYNTFWLVDYYGNHLKQLGTSLNDVAKNMMVVQVSALGNYTKGHGRALQQFSFFTLYSQLSSTFYPKKYAFNVMIGLTLGIIYLVGMYNNFKSRKEIAGIMKFFLIVGLMIGTMILPLTTLLTFGETNLSQHMLPVSFSLDLVYLILIADVIRKKLWKGTSQ
ncbi:hypothetical protein [Lentilactobacillus sp. SPB1-3]|uniref:Uncharacterized protein n=1 Tax=Lentilactobacillus terminaliae TaxID=3003483 RepID=A0ACD5DFA7_9LACO|nr:hypothetical protein [Lentilactobacillus sp. SPB1-3]MCZ0976585.1 hypothetical protein [Lentilactobacillus sp. SPB1-3]